MEKIIFDTETTGLLKPSAQSLDEQPYIIEIHAVRLDDEFQLVDEFGSFVKPPIPISDEITKITGINDVMVKDAPTFAEVYQDLVDVFLGTTKMIAHNLPFDRSMLANELLREDLVLKFPWPPQHLCTVEAAMPIEQRRINLSSLHQIATGKPHEGAHRAKEDVYALVRCYHYLVEKGLSG